MDKAWVVVAVLAAGCTQQSMATTTNVPVGPVPESVTYYNDVLPLAQTHCGSCHRPGGIGPFSMLDYADAKSHAQVISAYIKDGTMPPWKPSDGCRSLAGTRKLTSDEQNVFTSWADGTAAAGDPSQAPVDTTADVGLPWTDRTMKMATSYTPPTGTTDQYQCFILDPKVTSNVDLIGYDVHPGTTAEVHHVLLYPANLSDAQALDDASPEPGWTCFGGPGTPSPQTVGGWVPGSSAVAFPAGTGIALTAGKILVLQVHYNLSYVDPSPDQTTVELQFAKAPVQKHAVILPLLNSSFSIPPGAVGYKVDASFTTPAAATIWGVLPHAHTHAQAMHVESDAGCMIDIPSWDFHWQQQYFFTDAMQVQKGQGLRLTCTYDNPGATSIKWGEKTSDEMCLNYMFVTQ